MELLKEYRGLLEAADEWFARCAAAAGTRLRCGEGCAGCCHGLFDVTLLDALVLQEAFALLPAAGREPVLARAHWQLGRLQAKWPDFGHPFLLNELPEAEWDSPEENATPCPLLDAAGRCLAYSGRPLLCRLHGLPHVDLSGEIFADDWCTRNFPGADPLAMPELRGGFRRLFSTEARLLRQLAACLGIGGGELDTYIATALLIDFRRLEASG